MLLWLGCRVRGSGCESLWLGLVERRSVLGCLCFWREGWGCLSGCGLRLGRFTFNIHMHTKENRVYYDMWPGLRKPSRWDQRATWILDSYNSEAAKILPLVVQLDKEFFLICMYTQLFSHAVPQSITKLMLLVSKLMFHFQIAYNRSHAHWIPMTECIVSRYKN